MVYPAGDSKVMNAQYVTRFIADHKKPLIFGVIATVTVGLLTFYVLWSIGSWEKYESGYQGRRHDLQSRLVAVMDEPGNTAEQRAAKRQGLEEVLNDVKATHDLCKIHTLLEWQKNFSSTKPKVEACNAQLASMESFEGSLQKTVDFIKSEASLAAIFKSAPLADKISEKDIAGQVARWREIEDKVARLDTATPFTPIKAEALGVINGIITAWQEVKAANDAKDRKKYEAAVGTLSGAYDALTKLEEQSAKALLGISDSLQSSYKSAFN